MKLLSLCITVFTLSGVWPVSPCAHAQLFDAVRLQRTAPGQDLGVIGLVASSGPAYAGSDEQRATLLPLLDYQWANGWFAGSSFGVKPVQASRSAYAVYTPRSGPRDARASASLTYALDPRSAVTAVAAATRMLGDAADSPLTRKRTAASAVLVCTHAF